MSFNLGSRMERAKGDIDTSLDTTATAFPD
ncbi:hypothetical protein HDA32_000888 [Spinactinospora alkalitolerans]|uniref:Uncharacterized protein n=1 Tax=Spinactinospora alkalitolerans TaxID=687207 RepID=A0A852TP90_9ACTN|nr:hypothetical protein [Spinactinospora alkalitolerans]